VKAALREAAEGGLRGILCYTDEPLVSSDLRGDPRSAVVSGPDTRLIGGRLAQVVAWYDNEWGYACRLIDLAAFVAARLSSAGRVDRMPLTSIRPDPALERAGRDGHGSEWSDEKDR